MSTFLTKDDLKTAAPLQTLSVLTASDDKVLESIVSENIARFSSYLQGRYDTKAIFATRDEDRPQVVLKYLKDLVIHDVYARQGRGHVGEVVQTRYKAALKWLEQIGEGRLSPDLPLRKGAANSPSMGAKPPYSSRF